MSPAPEFRVRSPNLANQINRLAGSTFPVMWLCPRCVRRSIGGRPGDLRCFLISNALAVALFGLCKHALICSWADGEPAEAANLGIYSSEGSFWLRVLDDDFYQRNGAKGGVNPEDQRVRQLASGAKRSTAAFSPATKAWSFWWSIGPRQTSSRTVIHSHAMSRSIGCSRARCGDPPRHRIAGRLLRVLAGNQHEQRLDRMFGQLHRCGSSASSHRASNMP